MTEPDAIDVVCRIAEELRAKLEKAEARQRECKPRVRTVKERLREMDERETWEEIGLD